MLIRDVAKMIDITGAELVSNMETTTASVGYMKKKNPKKYELLLLGGVCISKNIDIEKLITMINRTKDEKNKIDKALKILEIMEN